MTGALDKTCTCHPDDDPPVPCERRYALSECREARQVQIVYDEMNRDPGKFYSWDYCALVVQFARALVKAGVIKGEK